MKMVLMKVLKSVKQMLINQQQTQLVSVVFRILQGHQQSHIWLRRLFSRMVVK